MPYEVLQEIAWWAWASLLYLLGTLVAIDALWQGRTAQSSLAWILGLIVVPFITLPLYALFGSRRFRGYVRARRHGHQALDKIIDHSLQQLKHVKAQASPLTKPLFPLFRIPPINGNRCSLLTTGQAFYDDLFTTLNQAQAFICVQFYILRSDNTGRKLATILKAKAQAGVKVYLLYDEIGSGGIQTSFLRELRQAGVQVSRFNSSRFRTRFQLNFRNHRKLVISDGHTAFVGGYNLGDEHLSNWRDTQVKIEGPAVLSFQVVFSEDWHWATGNIPMLNWEAAPVQGAGRVMCIASGPADDTDSASLYFSHLINSAEKRCWLVSPYFVPDRNLSTAIQLAALRGVAVKILVPGESDNRLVQQAMYAYIDELRRCGVEFYTYKKGFLHQKVMLIDDKFCSIGSTNMDNRSLHINFEINALIKDDALVAEVKQMLEQDFKDAKITAINPHWWPVFLTKCAKLFSPVL
ncbi:MAG: cardiolipin synthase [Venatoribacter sp.]